MKKQFIILFVFVSLLLSGCGKTSVELTQFVSVNYAGLDTYATANVDFDYGAFEDLIMVEFEDMSEIELLGTIVELESSIDVSIDKTDKLSNGDEITVNLSWDEDVAEKYDLSFSGSTEKVTVNGLVEGTVVDLFKDIVIELDGVSPEANLILGNSSQDAFLKNVSYRSDVIRVANGDEVVITAIYNTQDALDNNYIIEETEKTFTMSGADEYITEYSQLDENTIETLLNQASDVLTSELTNDYEDIIYPNEFIWPNSLVDIQISSKELVNSYFFSLKDGIEKGYSDVNNSIFLVYEISTTDSRSPDGKTIYATIYCSQFKQRESGEIYFSLNDIKFNNSFQSTNDLYIKVVDSNKAKYEFEEIVYE